MLLVVSSYDASPNMSPSRFFSVLRTATDGAQSPRSCQGVVQLESCVTSSEGYWHFFFFLSIKNVPFCLLFVTYPLILKIQNSAWRLFISTLAVSRLSMWPKISLQFAFKPFYKLRRCHKAAGIAWPVNSSLIWSRYFTGAMSYG